jgi:uncharacterized protein YneF (UPF0154 family)
MKPKTKAIVFILISFILGILCGWFLEDRILRRMPHERGRGHADFVKVLNKQLHLDSLQIIKVDSILESNKKKMEVFKKQALAMRDTTRIQIRRVLNAEQSKLFDGFNQERDKEETMRFKQEPPKKQE